MPIITDLPAATAVAIDDLLAMVDLSDNTTVKATILSIAGGGYATFDLSVSNATMTAPTATSNRIISAKADNSSTLTLPDMSGTDGLRPGQILYIVNDSDSPSGNVRLKFNFGGPNAGFTTIEPGQFCLMFFNGPTDPPFETVGDWSYTISSFNDFNRIFELLIPNGYPGGQTLYDLSGGGTTLVTSPIPLQNIITTSTTGTSLVFPDITADPMKVGQIVYVLNGSSNTVHLRSFSSPGLGFDFMLPPGYEALLELSLKVSADGTWWTKLIAPVTVPIPSGTDSGAANAYVVTTDLAATWVSGKSTILVVYQNGNTTASTINVDGAGVLPLTSAGNFALTSGQITDSYPGLTLFMGDHWELLNPAP